MPGTVEVNVSGPSAISANLPATTTYSQFLNRVFGRYYLSSVSNPFAGYTYIGPCPNINYQDLTTLNPVATWDLVFGNSIGWFQIAGGSIHSNNNIRDPVPPAKKTLVTSVGFRPGVISYSDLDPLQQPQLGSDVVVPGGYLVHDGKHVFPTGYSWYDYYLTKFTTPTPIVGNSLSSEPGPAGSGQTVLISSSGTGNLTINTAGWDIENGKSVVIFVPGNLTLTLPQNIRIIVRAGGFLAFIVKGTVTVAESVGSLTYVASADPITGPFLSGIIITNSTFTTNPTASVADRQLIVAGTVVANNFSLRRDLGASNSTYPGELFIYRPDLWRSAPNSLKEIDLTWKEVAP